MAKISPELKLNLTNLQKTLLDIVDETKAAEFLLLERFGETNETIIALDELTAISQQAADLYIQISRLLLRTAEIQPAITPDLLRLLEERIATIDNRVPALERSTQEIKTDWGLL
ncbi:MAG: hypothetical protein QNJ18_06245 [Xenococcaceae cyanobacterium MO_167.B52]|nr:hypothetical protein [Xenococcaceae cyanobacterium MO_167.B52]